MNAKRESGVEPLIDDGVREFKFTRRDFDTIRRLIHAHAGIALNDCKQEMVYSRLGRRLRTLGLDSFSAYIEHIKAKDSEELQIFVNALTTNLTYFFREPHHFTILAEHCKRIALRPPFRIWSAACATGEEVYSIAMSMAELYGGEARQISVLGTDLDTEALSVAAQGIYPMERVESLPAYTRKRFFLKGKGNQAGFARVTDELRAMVRFRQLNLSSPRWDLNERFAAIFCRNVMIYFDKPTQLHVLSRFVPLLESDGLLFAGHSESLLHAAHLFTMRERTTYALAAQAQLNAAAHPITSLPAPDARSVPTSSIA